MPPKKNRKARRGEDEEEHELTTQPSNSTEATEPDKPSVPPKRGSKKKQAKKKGKALGDWSDEEGADPLAEDSQAGVDGTENANGISADAAEAVDDELEPSRQKSHKAKKGKGPASFSALSLADDPEAEAEAEAEAPLRRPPKAKKGKKSAAASFAALSLQDDEDDFDGEAEEKPQAPKAGPGASFAALESDPEVEAEEELQEEQAESASGGFVALREPNEGAEPGSIAQTSNLESEEKTHGMGMPPNKSKKGKWKATIAEQDKSSSSAGAPIAAQILSVKPHPNADKLKICTIDTGSEKYQVVTNAATAREGLHVAFAGIGVLTPGSGTKIQQASVRGSESFGMLCSAYDLGWVSDPDGVLIELPESSKLGEKLPNTPVEGALFGGSVPAENGAAKGKKKKSKKEVGFADLDEIPETVDSLAEPTEAPALPAKKSKKKKGGSEKAAAAFAALGLEEDEETQKPEFSSDAAGQQNDVGQNHGQLQEEAETSVASREPTADVEPAEISLTGKKKKGRSKAFDPDAVLAAAIGESSEPTPSNGQEGESLPLEKQKKGKKKSSFDVDAMLEQVISSDTAAVANESSPSIAENGTAVASAEQPGTESKGKKKKGKDDDDLDALLAQFGVDAEAAAAESKKGKKKKKGKAPVPELAEAPSAELATPATEASQEPSQAPASDVLRNASGDAAHLQEEVADVGVEEHKDLEEAEIEGMENKELSAAQKKKLKKKAKEKAKKAGKDDGEEGAPPAATKKGSVHKEPAAVRKLREEMERQRAAQEAAQNAEEERIRKEEEEERRLAEEQARREEEKRLRKEERVRQRAELKRQGLLKTGREKQEAERLAAMREQFLKNADGNLPSAEDAPQKKKVVYGKKKTQPKKEAEAPEIQPEAKIAPLQTPTAQQPEAELQATEPENMEEIKVEAEVPETAAEEKEDSDSVGWEDMDAEQIKLPGKSPGELVQEEVKEREEVAPQPKDLPNGKAKAAEIVPPEAKKAKLAPPDASAEAESSAAEDDEEGSAASDESSEDTEDEDSEEETSTEYESSEAESLDSEEEREERLRLARAARAEKMAAARQAGSKEDLRSPICCILGHVDTGKTKLLDNIRRTSVQEGEAGGITQQIGATYVPGEALRLRTEPVRQNREFGLKLPGLLIIDTPGHESFTNLRSRGSSLCDIAILVVDIMHGLEPQTIESINLLKQKKTPFIVALNKVDRLFEWKAQPNAAIQSSLTNQQPHVNAEFEKNLKRAILNLNEQGLNVALYWKNPDPRKYVNIVPTSAISGEGIPDMLQLLVQLTQKMMAERLMFISELQCTVLEVKVIEGLGTTIDVVLVNGVLHEGDQIVLCGLGGPIVTTIRSLLTPHPLKELRVRGSYLHHKEIKAAQGIKIAAQNLESAVAGTQMLVVQKGDRLEDLKEEVMGDMTDIFKSVDKSGEGVCVQASTLGSLEALLEFLRSDAVRIPVSGINIGPVHKRDVMRASTMLEKGRKKFAVILAFDVPVTREAQEQATSTGVRVFTADIIYHLFDQFSAYLKQTKEEEQQAAAQDAVFPVILQILQNCIFNTKDPIVLGCSIEEGIAKVGTPLCVPSRGGFTLGRISSMELNHKPVDIARRGDSVAMKIESTSADESARLYGRHFDFNDKLVSKITRRSIDLLKQHFKDDLEREDWRLVVKLKKMFGID